MAKVASFFHIFLILSFYYNVFQAIHASDATYPKHNSFSLKMVHWNSPELPSHQPNLTHEEIMDELVRISDVRLKTLEQLLNILNYSSPSSNGAIRPRLEPVMSLGVYLVEVGIGTFPSNPHFHTYYLLLDTATDHTWTQCEGCNPCFPQRGPHFQWRQSHTYRTKPCTHCPACQHGYCVFNRTFGVDDYITGAIARDTFTFQSQRRSHDTFAISQVEFICVMSSQGFMGGNLPQDNVASGVLALGRQGYSSLMTHVEGGYINDGRFSYCLLPLHEPIQHPMYLRFGRDIPRLPFKHETTPILQAPNPGAKSFYYLKLVDLKVGGKWLGIDPQVFKINQDGSGGCIIDSATPISYITRVAYDRLEQALAKEIKDTIPTDVRRVHSPFPSFPLCYEQTSIVAPYYPTVTFHFAQGAELDVFKPMGNYTHDGRQLQCLQIQPSNSGTTVLGAMQQVNHRFVYDTRLSLLHFYMENCAVFN